MEADIHAASSRGAQLSRETLIGLFAFLLSLVLMAVEQLAGSSPGLDDPIGFVVNTVLLVVGAYVFGVIVPRTKAHPSGSGIAAPFAFALSVAAIPTMFVALPFVLSGGAIALGLMGRKGRRVWLANTAIAIGGLVTLMSLGYLSTAGIGG